MEDNFKLRVAVLALCQTKAVARKITLNSELLRLEIHVYGNDIALNAQTTQGSTSTPEKVNAMQCDNIKPKHFRIT